LIYSCPLLPCAITYLYHLPPTSVFHFQKTFKLPRSVNAVVWLEYVHACKNSFLMFARTYTHQPVYATRPLVKLLQYHPPRTLVDAVECFRRLEAEVPRLQFLVAALQPTWSPEAAALLSEVFWAGKSVKLQEGEGYRSEG
jgi:hypothetical protein